MIIMFCMLNCATHTENVVHRAGCQR